jgi:hypothetical protein
MLVVAAMCASPGRAGAADGDMYIDGCVARVVSAPCSQAVTGLPQGVAVSPDGRQLYVGTTANGVGSFTGLQIYDVNASGVATPRAGKAGCFAQAGYSQCTTVMAMVGFGDPLDVQVTPDGSNVIAIGYGGSLYNFSRDPGSGGLEYVNCVGPAVGCTAFTAGAVAYTAAVDPNSQNVYVKTNVGLAILDRDGDTLKQKPTFDGCLSEGNVTNCTDVDGLAGGGFGLSVSPDGAHVYVAFSSPGGVSIFKRSADGRLAPIVTGPAGGCISANGASGGTNGRCVVGNNGLANAVTAKTDSDGRFVYVGGVYGFTVYARDASTGGLRQIQCFGVGTGCQAAPAGVSYVYDLVSPRGRDEVITAAYNSEAVTSFMRNRETGLLTPRPGSRGCVTSARNPANCLRIALINNDHYLRLAASPDGLRVYITGRNGFVASITRDMAPVCDPVNVETLQNTAVSVPLSCHDENGDSLQMRKAQLPATGQLGEILDNASVFYSPFGNFLGTDTFSYQAVARGVTGPPATVSVNVVAPAPPPPPAFNPSGLDSDRDGFTAGQDCNDNNAVIRPAAQEIKGNNVDENCDSVAEPFPTVTSGIVSRWDVKGSRLTLTTLQVTQQFPKGWKAKIFCKGKRCPFRSKTLKAGKVRRGAATIISSLRKSQRRFRAGQTIEVWVSAPGFNTKVARLVLKKGKIPTTVPFCVKAGETRVQKTCS